MFVLMAPLVPLLFVQQSYCNGNNINEVGKAVVDCNDPFQNSCTHVTEQDGQAVLIVVIPNDEDIRLIPWLYIEDMTSILWL